MLETRRKTDKEFPAVGYYILWFQSNSCSSLLPFPFLLPLIHSAVIDNHEMGFFGKKKKKQQNGVVSTTLTANKSAPENMVTVPEQPPPTIKSVPSTPPVGQKSLPEEPTMDMLPDLIRVLQISKETSSNNPARALRQLFALSEHGHTENRTKMVWGYGKELVPSLLGFLERCQRSSSAQYLTLLVLNNISIPIENKRVSTGWRILSTL